MLKSLANILLKTTSRVKCSDSEPRQDAGLKLAWATQWDITSGLPFLIFSFCCPRRGPTYRCALKSTSPAGEMAQLANCFLCKHQDMSLIPRTHDLKNLNKQVDGKHVYNPSLWRQRQLDPWGPLVNSLYYPTSPKSMKDPVYFSKDKVNGAWGLITV